MSVCSHFAFIWHPTEIGYRTKFVLLNLSHNAHNDVAIDSFFGATPNILYCWINSHLLT